MLRPDMKFLVQGFPTFDLSFADNCVILDTPQFECDPVCQPGPSCAPAVASLDFHAIQAKVCVAL